MDLADMQSLEEYNDGYRYLLVCIDVFSKYAWLVPIKSKTRPALVEAFKASIIEKVICTFKTKIWRYFTI